MGVFWSLYALEGGVIFTLLILEVTIGFSSFNFYLENSKDFFYEIERNLNGSLYYSFDLKSECNGDEEPIDLGQFNGCIFNGKFNHNSTCTDTKVGISISKQINKWDSKYICAKKSEYNYRYLLKKIFSIEENKEKI